MILYPASVQGAAAAQRNRRGDPRLPTQHAQVDVLIVCRGGGSLEDLWAFNEEVVARAVVDSRLPIVSGVGPRNRLHDLRLRRRRPRRDADGGRRARRARARGACAERSRDLAAAPRAARMRIASAIAAQRLDAASPPPRASGGAPCAAGRARPALGERLARAFAPSRGRARTRRVDAARARLVRELRTPLPQAVARAASARALERAARDRVARASRDVAASRSGARPADPKAVLERGYAIVTDVGGSSSSATCARCASATTSR